MTLRRPVLLDAMRLDRRDRAGIAAQIHAALRAMVLDGTLAAGARLPSSRALAASWGVARNTVVAAIERLTAEGFLAAERGSGTYVSELAGTRRLRPRAVPPAAGRLAPRLSARGREAAAHAEAHAARPPGPLAPDIPALDRFPLDAWHRSLLRSARRHRASLLHASDRRGFAPLRAAIAAHIGPARGVICDPDQVIVLTSTRQSIAMIAALLADPGERAAIENPGYLGARAMLTAHGLKLVAMPVDGEGANPEALARERTLRLIYLTPSHQYPLGPAMSLARRMATLAAADRLGAWIIEDDYDGEFQVRGHPAPSLHGLSAGRRVIYLGTFSKAMFPALRLAYLVAPPDLVDAFAALRIRADGMTALHPQAALADFMESGAFAMHIRRMRALYAEREAALLGLAARRLAGACALPPPGGGLQLAAPFRRAIDDAAFVARLDPRLAAPAPLSRYYLGRRRPAGLVMGFANADAAALGRAVDHIAHALDAAGRKGGPRRNRIIGPSA